MARNKRIPTCHPDRNHAGLGLCNTCYTELWYKNHPDKKRAKRARYRINQKDHICQAIKKCRENKLEEYKFVQQVYAKREKASILARSRARQLSITKACPAWVNKEEIKKIYLEAETLRRETGLFYEVDHIYPLNNKESCGLHVPWNLRIILRSENRSKGNKLPEAA